VVGRPNADIADTLYDS